MIPTDIGISSFFFSAWHFAPDWGPGPRIRLPGTTAILRNSITSQQYISIHFSE